MSIEVPAFIELDGGFCSVENVTGRQLGEAIRQQRDHRPTHRAYCRVRKLFKAAGGKPPDTVGSVLSKPSVRAPATNPMGGPLGLLQRQSGVAA